MLKRVLSFCLSVALVLSMVPAQAFATEPETVPIETVAETTVPETTREETSPVTEPQGTTAPIETQIPETTAPTAAESVPETTAEETVPETTAEETVPETTEETVPETTVEETVPEATEEETVPETTEETIVEETVEETVAEEAMAGGTCGSDVRWDYADGVLTISPRYSGFGGYMNDYSTSSRPDWYSSYRTKITEVVVEKGVLSIGAYAFVGLENLEKVSLSTDSYNASTIGAYAFQGCTKLTEVSGLGSVDTISEGAFAQCSKLASVDLAHVYEVGTEAFKECTSLTDVTLSQSGRSWTVTLGESIFSGCTGLKEVTLYVNPTKYMFENCTALETVTMSSSLVTEIGYGAFQGCTALKTVEFSSYITTIGSYAFKNAGLKYIYFLGSAPTINSYAFYGVSASARYPYGNTTWTSSKCANYGGTLSWSYDNRCGDGVTWYLNTSSGALTISGSGAMKDYKSASSVPWYSARKSITKIIVSSGVTSIGNYAFSSCTAATSVSIAGTVTDIGNYAFYYCNAVTSVTIPSSVKTVGDYAFQLCTAMTSLTLNSGLTDIGKYAFQNCYNLTGITLPESTATIGAYAFGSCVKLPSMTIPAGVTSIGDMAFGGCNGLTEIWVNPANKYYCSDDYGILYDKEQTLLIKAPTCLSGSFAIPETVEKIDVYAFDDCVGMTEVTIPDSVTTIEQCAFYYCSGLTTVNMGSGVTTIGKQAFDNCSALTAIVIPEGVTTVGEYTFRQCTALETVTLPEGLTTIDGYAFYNCDSLESGTLPEGLTTIGTCAFYNCDSLETVSVPAAVTSIGSQAFGSCDSLTAISVDEENATYASDARGVLLDKDMTTLIHAPGGLTDGYAVPGTVTTIASNAFASCKKLLAVYIPSNVTTIKGTYAGYGPFYQCSTGLVLYCEEYSAPSGWGADWNGYGSTTSTLTVKWGVTAEEGAFWVADAFAETVVIPEYLSSLPECAFYGHTNLKTVTIPEGITTLPKSVFSGCTGLTKVNMHKRLTTFEDYALSGCTGFKAFYIPATVTSITAYTFNSCDSNMIFYCEATEAPSGWASSWNGSRKVVWGTTEDTYDFWSSEEAPNPNVVIPEGITQIPDYAFYNRTDLLSVTVPDSVTSIGQYAFYGCTGLTEAPIGNGVESIGTYAFYGCTGLNHAFIPASVTTITSRPFYGCSTGLVVYCEVSSRPDTWSETWTQVGNSSSSTLTAHFGASKATYDFFTGEDVLASELVIPEGVTIIPSYAFTNRTDLLSVAIPGSVKTIGSYAFWGCTALERVILGSGVEEIGSQAFRNCSALKTLFIPDTVTTMGDSLFYCASQTAVVYCEPASQPESWPSGWRTASTSSTSKSLTVRWNFSEAFFRFLMSEAGQAAEVVIPEGFTIIPDYAFAGRTDLTAVTLPAGITSIGEGVFQGCTGLVSLIIPDGVTSIGEYAFQDCTGLRRVYIPASVTSIPGDYWIPSGASYAYYLCNSPFEGCNSALVLYCEAEEKPEGWEECWNCYYFYNYANWYTLNVVWGISQEEMQTWFEAVQKPEVVIPESVTSIPTKAFYNRTDLTSVTIGENVTTIGAYAFYGCTGLTEVTIPESVTTIGAAAFYGCTGLTEVTIPITVTSVGYNAFSGCSNLTLKYEGTMEQWMEIGYSPCTVQCSDGTIDGFGTCGTSAKWTLINGVLRIYGSGAMTTYTTSSTAPWYSLRTKITSAVIESGVTTVGGYAFDGCTNLASVEIASTVTTVYSYVFRNCSALTSVVFQGSAPSFYSSSFYAITTTAYYPAGDTTWTDSVMQNYGGTVTWVATCLGEHTVVVDAAVSATCLETGLTEGSHCSACGMILVAQTTVASLGHDYGDWTDTKAATCTTGGTQRRDCSRCDAYETKIIYALGHNEVVDAYVASTCTETGLTEGAHCDRCGLVTTAQETLAALGHVEVIDAAVAATCTATGLTEGRHCSRCNEILTAQQIVPMEEHPYGDWIVTLAPTCTAAGSESRTCTACGHIETRAVDALGHAEVIDAALAATCLETGLTEGKHCSRCNEILVAQTVTAALGHKEVTDKAVAPNCTAAGKTEGSHCSRCAAVFTDQEVIPALGHIEVTDAAVAATCLKTGLTEGKHCSRCSEILITQTVIPALGHKEVIDAAAAPTCLETGLTEGKHCSRCNEILTGQTVIPALGHVETVNPGVEATCLENGLTEGKFCSRCGEILVAREVVGALGHVEAVDAAVAPDCVNTGLTEGSHCERCSTVLVAQEELPALGHEEVIDAAVAPACLETGLTEGRHCARCEEILVAQELIDATGHDYFYGICRFCAQEIPSDYQLYASKSLTLKITNPATGKLYKTTELTWEMEDIFEPFATLKNGKLTAKKVVERVRLGVKATVVATGEEISYLIDIYPALTQVEVKKDEEIVNGKTLVMDFSQETMTLKVDAYPLDTLEKVTWTVSDKKGQYAEYTADGSSLAITNPIGRAGTVTIKATVEAGVKKNVTVKVKFGNYARAVTILEPEKTTLRGGESMQLQAYVSEPAAVSTPGIVWTTSDKTVATVSNGKVTAKNVVHPTAVTLTATSKDGQASASIELQILPKDEGKLVIREDGRFITNATRTMNVGDTCLVSAAVVSNGEAIPAEAAWTSSKDTVAVVDRDGRITATGAGTAKITATFNGLTAVLNIKVATLVNAMEITTKDGRNLAEENGEKIVLLSSGKNVTLVANVLTAGAAKTVDWAITEGAQYAKIASGKVTANKDLTSVQYITVKATAKDGSGVSATIRVKIVPLATGVQIYESGIRVRSNTTYIVDMQTKPAIKLTARVYPAKANQTVVFSSSNKKIADFNKETGELECYKTGTVTITATAQDGSGAKTTFKLTVIKQITDLQLKEGLQLDENGNLFVAGGKSLKLASMVQINPGDATNKKLTWKVSDNDHGIKVSSTGVLTTKKVAQPVTVNIMVTAQDGSGEMLSFNVTVYPV